MKRWVFLVVGVAIVAIAACATGELVNPSPDASVDGSSGCLQFDLMTDPMHCGSCTNACASGEVCSAGQCKNSCDLPTYKCASGDGGSVCADLKTDTNHCGTCTTSCAAADAGGLQPGTNNPDAGFPYDGGTGWSVGSPTCEAGTCGTTCTGGFTVCSDGICYDTQNFHDHCGSCATACTADTEWCALGQCCPVGQMYCSGACTDVLFNNSNCGGCGNTCSGSTPYCSQGTCVMACVPSGSRQPFNTLSANTTTGCWTGNACAQGTYSWTTTHGNSFEAIGQAITCGGTTACVSHVGITTYQVSSNCQGTWDVYCDTTKVGTIDTAGLGCSGDAMTNGCSTSFMPVTCSTIKLVATAGSVGGCCGAGTIDTMLTGVSAW